jgi:hypothetical protein
LEGSTLKRVLEGEGVVRPGHVQVTRKDVTMTDTAASGRLAMVRRVVRRVPAYREWVVPRNDRSDQAHLPMRRVLLLLGATLLFAGGALLTTRQ